MPSAASRCRPPPGACRPGTGRSARRRGRRRRSTPGIPSEGSASHSCFELGEVRHDPPSTSTVQTWAPISKPITRLEIRGGLPRLEAVGHGLEDVLHDLIGLHGGPSSESSDGSRGFRTGSTETAEPRQTLTAPRRTAPAWGWRHPPLAALSPPWRSPPPGPADCGPAPGRCCGSGAVRSHPPGAAPSRERGPAPGSPSSP